MCSFEIADGIRVGGSEPCFIIAEIGQNHNGNVDTAKLLIFDALLSGADCVKFQKSDLKSRFNSAALQRPYISRNSFGATYGEHRQKLELSEDDIIHLQQYAEYLKIEFTASGMDKVSIDFLNRINVPFFKIGSGDANNFPLLLHTAKLGKPMVISTGMQNMQTVCEIYDRLFPINKRIAILQCTSSYPTEPEDVNLNVIKTYQNKFPEAVIGYSGHEKGIGISIAAVAMGAKIIERHITLEHDMKGSDHEASLEPSEFECLVREIRRVERALGSNEKGLQHREMSCYDKLAKTIVAAHDLDAGTVIKEDMLDIKVAEPKGWKAEDLNILVNKRLKNDIKKDCSITLNDVFIEVME